MKDFGIPMDRVLMGLDKDMAAHNKGVSLQEKKSFFFMNHSWGSAGWFSGCGWPLIQSVPKSHWRWNPQLLEADEGQIVLGDNGRPKFVKGRSEEHTSELQSPDHLVCRLLLEKKKAESRTQP